MLTSILVEIKRAVTIVMNKCSVLTIRNMDVDMLPFETDLPPLNALP